MADQTELKVVIKAIDEASATLRQIASNTSHAGDQVATSSEKSGMSFGKLTASIITSQLAYEALSKTFETVKGFFEASIHAAMEQSATLVQVQVDVKNAGLSYDALASQIDEVAQRNIALGFTDNQTQLSMGKLILATGDYNQALKLNHLAMDLAVAKHLSLDEASVLIQQVMAGNTRVLKTYGISLDSATTSADALNIVQEKVGGSADALAGAPLGHMREVQAQWDAIKEEVGNELMPTMEQLFKLFDENIPNMVAAAKGLADVITVVTKAANMVAAPFRIMGDTIGNVINVTQGLGWQQLSLQEAFTGSDKKASTLTGTFDKLNTGTSNSALNFDDVKNRIQKANGEMVKHSEAVEKLSVEYNKMREVGLTNLAELRDAFQTKMGDINKAIGATMIKMGELSDSYVKTQKDDAARVADSIVASEQKISALKVQISNATTAAEAGNLDVKLNKEQLGYASAMAFATTHANAMATARQRFNMTDLERTIVDYNTKQALDTVDYQKKLAALQQELLDKRKEAEDEKTLFSQKSIAIAKILDESQVAFKKLSDERVDMTTKEVDKEIAQFQRLATSIGALKSASAISLPTIGIPHFATGGIVTSPTIGLIGEAGPEAIIPLSAFTGGSALAGNGSTNGGGIIINITGNNISSAMDLRRIADAVGDEIVRGLRLNQRMAI